MNHVGVTRNWSQHFLSLFANGSRSFPSLLYNLFSVVFSTHLPGSLTSTHKFTPGTHNPVRQKLWSPFHKRGNETNSLKNLPQIMQASKNQPQNRNSGVLSPAPALGNAKIQSNHQFYHSINVLILGGGKIHTENLPLLPFLSI